MKEKKSFLKLHKELMNSNKGFKMTWKGLCFIPFNGRTLLADKIFGLTLPTLLMLDYGHLYWGSGNKKPLLGVYTPLRQNLILLCAAINREL